MQSYPSEVLKVTENRIWGQKSASELYITQFKHILIHTGLCKWLFYHDLKTENNTILNMFSFLSKKIVIHTTS